MDQRRGNREVSFKPHHCARDQELVLMVLGLTETVEDRHPDPRKDAETKK